MPAFVSCIDPNSQHGPPLTEDACAPPRRNSDRLTIGTPDANGNQARSIESFSATPRVTSAGEGDLEYRVRLTDVRRQPGLDDYTGELRAEASLRLSDRHNGGPSGADGATMEDAVLALVVPCGATAAAFEGSTCALEATANSLAPGTIEADTRAIWELGQVRVFDGGTDDDADTTADNNLFAVEGVFVP